MMDKMRFRGPDDDGVYIEENVGFGYVRLSIIDLTYAGHQPMLDNSGRYILIYNGEIFNYLELKNELKGKYHFKTNTDSEVLLAAYIIWGKNCLDKFNGMWSFAIYDKQLKETFIARDRYGEKPLYYYKDDNELVFASDIHSIHAVINKKLKPNNQIIFDYLKFNRTDQNTETFIEGVYKLEHGHYIEIKNNNFSTKKWYELTDNLNKPFNNSGEYLELLTSSVNMRMRADVPLGVCLSGGIDSSAITALMLANSNTKDLHSFSAVYGHNIKGDESDFIKLFNNKVKHLHLIYPNETSLKDDFDDLLKCHFEPFSNLSIYSQFKVLKETSKYVKVALDGQGADEQLGGYHYFFASNFKDLLKNFKIVTLLKELLYYYKNHHSAYAYKMLVFYLLPDRLKNIATLEKSRYLNHDFYNVYVKESKLNNHLFDPENLIESLIQHFKYKLEHNLKWNDLNSMYFSLELRAPFMDFRLIERTLSSSSSMIINKGTTKYILRDALKGLLDDKIRLRQDKIGFDNPSEKWMKESFIQEKITTIIENNNAEITNYFNLDKVKKDYKRFTNGEINIEGELWKLINLDYFLNHLMKEKNE
jgi:asparagine synthase (glutamine-hydrolysing)